MRFKRGFTLLELLIVVVIVGILAGLAIPRYQKSVESGRAAEAYVNLGAIRQAEWDHYGRTGQFIVDPDLPINGTDFSNLMIEDPNDIPITERRFTYYAVTYSYPFELRATRNGGPYSGDYIIMSADGSIDESGWLQ